MIEEYMESLDACIVSFSKCLKLYNKDKYSKEFTKETKKTHKFKSIADDIRREIELKLYGKALLPESRGDVLGMLESLDKIASVAEDGAFILDIEKPEIPDFLKDKYYKLIDINLEAFFLIRKAVDAIRNNPRETLYINKEIDMKESESDKLEEKMFRKLFDSDMPLAQKHQQQKLIRVIGAVSDRCQNSADRISIIAIKRRV